MRALVLRHAYPEMERDGSAHEIERSLEILSQGGAYIKERVTIAEEFKG